MRKGILIEDTIDCALVINPVRIGGFITEGLVVGDTDKQNVDLIITAAKGEFKEYPVLGVGILNFLKSTGREREMKREISVQLGLDGYTKTNVSYTNGLLNIEI